jgi:orotidine-5'-phosphate decarboxylase
MAALRQAMPEVVFLVPGYGSQGGKPDDVAPAFRPDGRGAIVSSSRGVLFPFRPSDANWEAKVEAAARTMIKELAPFSNPAKH